MPPTMNAVARLVNRRRKRLGLGVRDVRCMDLPPGVRVGPIRACCRQARSGAQAAFDGRRRLSSPRTGAPPPKGERVLAPTYAATVPTVLCSSTDPSSAQPARSAVASRVRTVRDDAPQRAKGRDRRRRQSGGACNPTPASAARISSVQGDRAARPAVSRWPSNSRPTALAAGACATRAGHRRDGADIIDTARRLACHPACHPPPEAEDRAACPCPKRRLRPSSAISRGPPASSTTWAYGTPRCCASIGSSSGRRSSIMRAANWARCSRRRTDEAMPGAPA